MPVFRSLPHWNPLAFWLPGSLTSRLDEEDEEDIEESAPAQSSDRSKRKSSDGSKSREKSVEKLSPKERGTRKREAEKKNVDGDLYDGAEDPKNVEEEKKKSSKVHKKSASADDAMELDENDSENGNEIETENKQPAEYVVYINLCTKMSNSPGPERTITYLVSTKATMKSPQTLKNLPMLATLLRTLLFVNK